MKTAVQERPERRLYASDSFRTGSATLTQSRARAKLRLLDGMRDFRVEGDLAKLSAAPPDGVSLPSMFPTAAAAPSPAPSSVSIYIFMAHRGADFGKFPLCNAISSFSILCLVSIVDMKIAERLDMPGLSTIKRPGLIRQSHISCSDETGRSSQAAQVLKTCAAWLFDYHTSAIGTLVHWQPTGPQYSHGIRALKAFHDDCFVSIRTLPFQIGRRLSQILRKS